MHYDKLLKTGQKNSNYYFRGELGSYMLAEADRPGMAYYITQNGSYMTGLFPTAEYGHYSGDLKTATGKIYLAFEIKTGFSEIAIEQS